MNDASGFRLVITRLIKAPREKVYDAFVTEEGLKAWSCPRGMTLPDATVDARVGGRFTVTMLARDGDSFTATGVYRELKRPERLAYSWQWVGEGMPPGETEISVVFAERDGGTELTMTHSGFADRALCDSHEAGWNSSLNRLSDLLDARGSAATLELYGDPRSSYTWSARLALAEKGLKYTMTQAAPHSEQLVALNPFGRIPAFRDGDLVLYETSAILRYIDECFDAPKLLPNSIRERARAEQWVSAINSYMYEAMVRRFVLQYIFPQGADGKPDRQAIDAALVDVRKQLAVLDSGYGSRTTLAGPALSVADLLIGPILCYVETMPEGPALMKAAPNVARALAALKERESFKATDPRPTP